MSDAQEEYKKKLEEALQEERERSQKAIEMSLDEERSKNASHIDELKVYVYRCSRNWIQTGLNYHVIIVDY